MEPPSPKSHFAELPDEMLQLILAVLPLQSLSTMLMACRSLTASLSKFSSLWERAFEARGQSLIQSNGIGYREQTSPAARVAFVQEQMQRIFRSRRNMVAQRFRTVPMLSLPVPEISQRVDEMEAKHEHFVFGERLFAFGFDGVGLYIKDIFNHQDPPRFLPLREFRYGDTYAIMQDRLLVWAPSYAPVDESFTIQFVDFSSPVMEGTEIRPGTVPNDRPAQAAVELCSNSDSSASTIGVIYNEVVDTHGRAIDFYIRGWGNIRGRGAGARGNPWESRPSSFRTMSKLISAS